METAAPSRLTPADRKRLLAVARSAIKAALCPEIGPRPNPPDLAPALLEPSAAFVTIRERGELRGCVGLMRFDVPLWINVSDAAVAAAVHDSRFLPVESAEVPLLELEVSVLQPPVVISDPAEFEAGRHGIVVERGGCRALLLPQVASEMGWGATQMLEAVCRKAGLASGAWRDRETRLLVFESECFGEDTPPKGSTADAKTTA